AAPDGANNWAGRMDTITGVNSGGSYIGRNLTASSERVPFLGFQVNLCTSTYMVNGQPVSFQPIDINDEGVVTGWSGSNSGMVIRAVNGTQSVFAGVYPVTINNHTRPVSSASPPPGASPTPTATPIPAPEILGWDGSATVVWERQPDGKTWQGFGLEEMIPSMD